MRDTRLMISHSQANIDMNSNWVTSANHNRDQGIYFSSTLMFISVVVLDGLFSPFSTALLALVHYFANLKAEDVVTTLCLNC